MKILFFAPRLPFPLSQADRMTVFYYLRHLSKKHEITLITFYEEDAELEYLNEFCPYLYDYKLIKLKKYQAYFRVLMGLLFLKPMQQSYYNNRSMKNDVMNWVQNKEFDIVYMHTIRMSDYIDMFRNTPKVLGLQISMGLNYKRMFEYHTNLRIKVMYGLEYLLIRNFEYERARAADMVFLISNKDIKFVEQHKIPLNNVIPLPHGVDHRYFKKSYNEPKEKAIIFTGKLEYPPNEDAVLYFLNYIFPLILKEHSDIIFYCIGKEPSKNILKYQSKNIVVTGFVDDLRPYLERSLISINPMRICAGLQNKVIEAMAMSLPVVCTSVANEGINAVDKRDLILKDDPREFADAICDLLSDENKRTQIAANARSFIEREYTWEYFLDRFEVHIENLHSQSSQ